jgi:hypothetical protein
MLNGCGGETSTGLRPMDERSMDQRPTVMAKETKGRRRHKVDRARKKRPKVDGNSL